jgi:hypothetical protein
MVAIPEFQNTTKHKIDCKVIKPENPRPYLGMSSIGDECERKLWLSFHWAVKKSFTPRVNRIFRVGHASEADIISDLKSIGINCFYRFDDNISEMTGAIGEKQEGFVDVAGHFKGHCDGRVNNVPEAPKTEHLLEMKTHNDKSFKEVSKKGVKEAKPLHYAQMQVYMHYAKLTRALYAAYNKNDSDYYFERVYYDKGFAEDMVRKASGIIMSEEIPACKFSKTWFACRWCEYKDICHGEDKPERNCRTCEKSDICNDGKWECSKTGKEISYDEQLKGCRYHKFGWGL